MFEWLLQMKGVGRVLVCVAGCMMLPHAVSWLAKFVGLCFSEKQDGAGLGLIIRGLG
jgi:hypothetical protein